MAVAELYDLKIDLDHLEKNAMDQVGMMSRATRTQATLKRRHAEAKLNLDLMEARLKRRIRSEPEKYNLPNGKVTEGAINEALLATTEYQVAAQAVIDARYQQDLIDGIVQALEHRKRMIETEVTLWQHSYFARPRVQAGSLPSDSPVRDKIDTAQKRSVRAKVNPLPRPSGGGS